MTQSIALEKGGRSTFVIIMFDPKLFSNLGDTWEEFEVKFNEEGKMVLISPENLAGFSESDIANEVLRFDEKGVMKEFP